MKDAVLAFDFGGTKLAVGVAETMTGRWLEIERVATPQSAEKSLVAITAAADRLVGRTDSRPVGVGVSFGGHVDSKAGSVRRSMQVPGWEGIPLAKLLTERFDAPTDVVNDGTAGALGEWRFGAAKGCSDVVYITVSTGVGGGLILDGHPYDGSTGLGAEFGHLPVPGSIAVCTCGSVGCLEAAAAGPAIATTAIRRVASGEPTSLRNVSHHLTGRDVSEHATAGDPVASEILADAGAAVGQIASNLVTCFDPQAVIVGGGVAHAADPFWFALRDAFEGPLREERWVKVSPADHIDEAPLFGALSLALGAAARKALVRR